LYGTGELVKRGDSQAVVKTDAGEVTVRNEKVFERNPARFDGAEDCATLSYLSEATVMHNLRLRYDADCIHTYSGLFLVVVNPYKRFPIYTPFMVDKYRGRRRDELPPHIFAVADDAYRSMLSETRNQSLLITGESGAGKTENTKKVIQYLAFIAGKSEYGKPGELEEQLLVANPIMESFGNACTNKNNNSSRFGKFIQLQFNSAGGIIGAKISVYLLEKSRVVSQLHGERNYHIFYQLMEGASKEMRSMLHLEDPSYYHFTNQGDRYKLEDMDDVEEFHNLVSSLKLMKVDDDEQRFVYSVIAGVLHLGNVQFVDERDGAQVADDCSKQELSLAAECFGVTDIALRKAIIEPAMKVGDREVINQHLDKAGASAARDALAKGTYQRLFMWMVRKLNEALAQRSESWFIGVLDIAGFEIFKRNSFEQLCINYTNEHLQHFFNQHMFKLEQEEYAREQIEWKFINFGMDLQPTIDLIEQKTPPGILSLLDENSVTKSNDTAFLQKLNTYFGKQRKHPKFREAQFAGSSFSVYHYAGIVEYDVTEWVDKNRDLFIADLDKCMRGSSHNFIAKLFKEDFGIAGVKDVAVAGKGNRGAAFVTVGLQHKEQLNSLMVSLRNTTPHFVRCILPNKSKQQHLYEEKVVVDQLKCNGVLEGIRITRMGYPNRIAYAEFLKRYHLLGKGVPRTSVDTKGQVGVLMGQLSVEKDQYQLGRTKIFFRVGVLAGIEELREKKIAEMILGIQACSRAFLARKKFVQLKERTISVVVLQQAVRAYIELKGWPWWKLFNKVRPLLKRRSFENELKEKDEAIRAAKAALAALEQEKGDQAAVLAAANTEVGNLTNQLHNLKGELEEMLQEKASSEEERAKLSSEIMILNDDIESCEDKIRDLKRKEKESDELADELAEKILSKENEVKTLKAQNMKYLEEVEALGKTLEGERDKYVQLEGIRADLAREADELAEQLEAATTKAALLNNQKKKLEGELESLRDSLGDEKDGRDHVTKEKKGLETSLLQVTAELEDAHKDLVALRAQLAKTEESMNDYRAKYESEANERKALEKAKKELDFQRQELEEDLAGEKSNGEFLAQKLKQLEKDNNEMQQQIADGQDVTQIMGQQKKKVDKELDELRTKVEQLTARVAQLEKEKRALENELAAIRTAYEESQNDNARLQKDKASLEKQLAAANEELNSTDKVKAEVERVKRVLEREKEEIEEQLEKALKECKAATEKSQELEGQVAQLNGEQDGLIQTKTNMESRLRSLQQELTLTQGQRDDEKIAREALDKRRKGLEGELEICREDLDTAEDNQKRTARELRTKTEQAEQLEKDLLTVTGEKENLAEKVKALQQENEELGNENDDLTGKALVSTTTIAKLQRSLDDALEQVEVETKGRQAAERNKRKLDGDHAALKSKYDALENQLITANAKFTSLSEDAETMRVELEEKDKANGDLKKNNKRFVAQLEAQKAQLEMAEEDVRKLTEKNKRLEAQLSEEMANPSAGGVPTELLQQKEEEIQEVRDKLALEIEARKDHEGKMKELRSALQAANEQVEVLSQVKDGAERNKTKMESTIVDLRKDLEEANRKGKMIDDDNKRKTSELKQLTAKLQGTVTSKMMDTDEVARLKDHLQQLLTDLDEERKTHGESEIQRKSLEAVVDQLRHSLEDEEINRDRIARSKRQLEEELESTKESLEEESQRVTELESEQSKLKLQVDDLQKRYDTDMSTMGKNNRSVAGLAEELARVKQELEDEHKRCVDIDRHRKRVEDEIIDADLRLKKETKDKMEAEKAKLKLERDLRIVKTKLDSELSTKSELENKLYELQEELDSIQVTTERETAGRIAAETKFNKLSIRHEDVSNEWQSAIRDKNRLEKEVKELTTRLTDSREAEDDLNVTRDTLKEAIARLTTEKKSLVDEVAKEREARDTLEDDKEKLMRENNDFKVKLHVEEEAKGAFEKTKNRLQAEVDERSNELDELTKKNSKLEREIKATNRQVDDLTKKCAELEQNAGGAELQRVAIELKKAKLLNEENQIKLKMQEEEKIKIEKRMEEERKVHEEEKAEMDKKQKQFQNAISALTGKL
jgi:myosin protein heavy chain